MSKTNSSANLKDRFDDRAARQLAEQIRSGFSGLDVGRFVAAATSGLVDREMMDRVRVFSAAIEEQLPADRIQALAAIEAGFPPPLPDCEAVASGWRQWPVGQWIAQFVAPGASDTVTASAMTTMQELTRRFTAEFAVRPFLRDTPERILPRLRELTSHECPHVRRWCSEGVRPLLPWGERLRSLQRDPAPILPILDALHLDEEEYVRRSVANCLGDVAKGHRELAIQVAGRWLKGSDDPRTLRLVTHALRAPIKDGDPQALALLGYGDASAVSTSLRVTPARLTIGESLTLTASLRATRPTRIMADLVIGYVKANGSRSPKVFKWSTGELGAGKELVLTKTLDLVQRSTRRLHPGEHTACLQVNGRKGVPVPFMVDPD